MRTNCAVQAAAANAFATAASSRSEPRAPTIDSPTGAVPTSAPGRLTCGDPVRPPRQVNDEIRSRGNASWEIDSPRFGAGNGVVGRHRIVPGGNSERSRVKDKEKDCAECGRTSEGHGQVSAGRVRLSITRSYFAG